MTKACLRPPRLTATCDRGTVRITGNTAYSNPSYSGAGPDVMPSESPSGQRNVERDFEGTGAAHGPLFLERGGCAATVKKRCRNLDLALLPWVYEITPVGDRNPGGSYDDRNRRA